MENKILYYLVFMCSDIEEQRDIVIRLSSLPDKIYDPETREMLKAFKSILDTDKLISPKTLNTYAIFNKNNIDIDFYFWDIKKKDVEDLDIDEASRLFIKEKEREINEQVVEKALEKYKASGDVSILETIDIQKVEERNVILEAKDAIEAGLAKLKLIQQKKDTKSIKFTNKFFYLQMILKGLEPGELVLLAARPGVGKTAFGLSLMHDISKQGRKSLYISLEMSREELSERMLIAKTAIPRAVFFSQDKFTEQKFEELVQAGKELSSQPMKFVDEPPSTFLGIKNLIEKEHARNGVEIVFVDYLSLIDSYSEEDRGLDTRTTVTKISRGFKLLAKKLKIPIVLIQQVNRNPSAGSREDSSFRELQLTDLRDSGALEQDANKVFLLWNKEPSNEEEKMEIRNSKYKVIFAIAKNRNGQTNQRILFEFNHLIQRIKEIDWLTKPSSWAE